MKKVYIYIALAVAAGAGIYFYSISQEPEKLKVGWADAGTSRLTVEVMKEQGIDKVNGLDIEVVWSNPGESLRKFINKDGGIEVSSCPTLDVPSVNAGGVSIKQFSSLVLGDFTLIVKSASPYRSIEDLKGAKIATRPKATVAYKVLAIGLKTAGMNLERDFKISFGSIPENIQSFVKGDADAVLLSASDAADFLAGGQYRAIIDVEKKWKELVGISFPAAGMCAHSDWLGRNSKNKVKLQKTLSETFVYILANPRIVKRYGKALNIKTEGGLKIFEENIHKIIPAAWDPKLAELVVSKAMELGIIERKPYDGLFID